MNILKYEKKCICYDSFTQNFETSETAKFERDEEIYQVNVFRVTSKYGQFKQRKLNSKSCIDVQNLKTVRDTVNHALL